MDNMLQQITTLLASLLGVWVGFRLARSSESSDRRRNARIRIRKMACEARGQIALSLFKIYDLRAPDIQSIKIEVAEDVTRIFGRRTKFVRLCDEFLSLPDSSYKPERDYGGDEARVFAWRKMVKDYSQRLDDIADTLK